MLRIIGAITDTKKELLYSPFQRRLETPRVEPGLQAIKGQSPATQIPTVLLRFTKPKVKYASI